MDLKELREKTIEELMSTAVALKKELASSVYGASGVDKKKELKNKKKELARVLTILGEKSALQLS